MQELHWHFLHKGWDSNWKTLWLKPHSASSWAWLNCFSSELKGNQTQQTTGRWSGIVHKAIFIFILYLCALIPSLSWHFKNDQWNREILNPEAFLSSFLTGMWFVWYLCLMHVCLVRRVFSIKTDTLLGSCFAWYLWFYFAIFQCEGLLMLFMW